MSKRARKRRKDEQRRKMSRRRYHLQRRTNRSWTNLGFYSDLETGWVALLKRLWARPTLGRLWVTGPEQVRAEAVKTPLPELRLFDTHRLLPVMWLGPNVTIPPPRWQWVPEVSFGVIQTSAGCWQPDDVVLLDPDGKSQTLRFTADGVFELC